MQTQKDFLMTILLEVNMFARFSKFVALAAIAATVTACSDDEAAVNTGLSSDANAGSNAGNNAGALSPDSLAYFNQEIGDRVLFGLDEYTLSAEAQDRLTKQAAWLKQYAAGKTVTIEGHCDERGTREYNIGLGARRAASVRNFLISQGVPAASVKAVSFGKERPAVEGSDESSWNQNRRGVTVVN